MRINPLKISVLFVLILVLNACTVATVRTIEEDRIAKEGFNPARYVSDIWENEFLPTLEENAIEITELLSEIDTDEDAAIEAYGNRTSTGPFSFMVEGEAEVLSINRESRVGLGELDLPPYDGEVDVYLAIGPVLRGNALRDSVGFIEFNDFTNQVEFAQISDALKERVDADLLGEINIDELVGETINFLGALTYDDPEEVVIMPVRLEVSE